MYEGTITRLVLDKGYGFITTPGQAEDVFLHCTQLVDLEWNEQLLERRVRFNIITNERGVRATNVRAAI